MKKSLLALAVLGAFAGAASAQSSITIYGVVDVGVTYTNNTNSAGSQWKLTGAGNQLSNRLGFRGQEDLGGGNFAAFNLETSVFPDAGQGGGYTGAQNPNTSSTPNAPAQLFDRVATVTLGSSSLGKVSLGRDYTPAFTVRATYDVFNYVGAANYGTLFSSSRPGFPVSAAFGSSVANPNTNVRANNSVAYYTPNISGFSAAVMGALGEGAQAQGGATTAGANKMFSASVAYGAGPLYMSAAMGNTKTTAISGQAFKNWALGGSYDFGVVKLLAMLDQEKYLTIKQRVFSLGLTAPVGPSGVVKAQYARSNVSGTMPAGLPALSNPLTAAGTTIAAGTNLDNYDANLFGLGYVHNLSKRTSLYTTVAQLKNKQNGTNLAIGSGALPAYGVGAKSTAYEFGVTHRF